MNHTSPPWEIATYDYSANTMTSYKAYHVRRGDGKSYGMGIADVWGCGNSKEDEANARLMVAAPELAAVLIEYEQLEGEMILDDRFWRGQTLPDYYYDRLIELQIKRNAALEKAGLRPRLEAKAAQAQRGES